MPTFGTHLFWDEESVTQSYIKYVYTVINITWQFKASVVIPLWTIQLGAQSTFFENSSFGTKKNLRRVINILEPKNDSRLKSKNRKTTSPRYDDVLASFAGMRGDSKGFDFIQTATAAAGRL